MSAYLFLGVASNTIHLVPRPPPQLNADTGASSSSDPSSSQQQQTSTNPPDLMNLRQTMGSLLLPFTGLSSG